MSIRITPAACFLKREMEKSTAKSATIALKPAEALHAILLIPASSISSKKIQCICLDRQATGASEKGE